LFDEAAAEKFQKWHSEHETHLKKRQDGRKGKYGARRVRLGQKSGKES
jgi:hypothetical protein